MCGRAARIELAAVQRAEIDSNGDGQVDFCEFLAAMESRVTQRYTIEPRHAPRGFETVGLYSAAASSIAGWLAGSLASMASRVGGRPASLTARHACALPRPT